MKINVFSIPSEEIARLKAKLSSTGMTVIKEVDQDDWHGELYYSTKPDPVDVPWADAFQDYFKDLGMPTNTSYFAAFLFTRADRCFALSYGKGHFYLRPYCDYDFGIELAKRIADESDIKQTASKRFQGKKKKDIRSVTGQVLRSPCCDRALDDHGAVDRRGGLIFLSWGLMISRCPGRRRLRSCVSGSRSATC